MSTSNSGGAASTPVGSTSSPVPVSSTTPSQQVTSSSPTPTPSSSTPPSTTSTSTSTTVGSTKPATTKIVTHITTASRTNSQGKPTVIVITRTTPDTQTHNTQTGASSSSAAALSGSDNGSTGSGGLSKSAVTAIAVVIPIVVVGLLVGFGIWFWRRRKARKEAEEQRRKEVEDYSYNPNGDPTLPAIGSEVGGAQMTEDHSSGYRGWGAATASNRKASTTLSGGHTQQLSDSGSNTYGGPSSPSGQYSDGHSSDPIVNNRDTMGSDDLGMLGVAPAAGAGGAGIKRGISNASSAYSGGGRSEHSDEAPPVPNIGQAYDYNPAQGYGYTQHGPYGDGTYGGNQDGGMPVVRDVSARRNTRIQQGGAYQQGNSGIAQNF